MVGKWAEFNLAAPHHELLNEQLNSWNSTYAFALP